MRYRHIKCEKTRFQATITLPGHAFDVTVYEAVAEEISDCCQELSLEDDLRVVSIVGQGDRFATGRQALPDELRDAPRDPAPGVAGTNESGERPGTLAHCRCWRF